MAQPTHEELKARGYRFEYGVAWPPLKAGKQVVPRPQWLIEKEAYNGLYGIDKSPYYLGKEEHFKRFLSALFDVPGSIFPFQWNPNACRILHAVLNNSFTSVLGCAGSSKSYTLAAIGVGFFLLNPSKTKVIVTSTTVETAKGKIWGDLCLAWDQACRAVGGEQFLPGKKMAAHPVIRYELNGIISQKIGIELLPTTQSSEKASVEKLQGYKGMSGVDDDSAVILIGDEWETLTPTIIQTARWNIGRRPNNRIIGAFNPTGRFTAGGLISKPKEGWESITMDDEEWETEDGICIRFDAHKSPNLFLKPGEKPWNGLITREELEQMESRLGSKDSPQYFCVDTETELLSKRGWLKHDEVFEGDEIYTLNSAGLAEWATVTNMFSKQFDGDLISMEGQSFSALVTSNHKWPITNRQTLASKHPLRIKRLRETDKLKKNDLIPLCRPPSDELLDGKYGEDFASLLGWIITDGTVFLDKKKGNRISVYQSVTANPEKCEIIRSLLKRLDARHCESGPYDGILHFQIWGEVGKRIADIIPDKRLTIPIIESMTLPERMALLNAIILGDGGFLSTHGTVRYCCTSDKDQADVFAALMARCGIATTTHSRFVNTSFKLKNGWLPNGKTMHYVVERKSLHTKIGSLKIKPVPYSGIVWCPTTKNGTFLMRRRGRTCFTGNTMVRAWFPPTGEATKIYSEAELTTEYMADHKVKVWITPPTKIAGLDPAFAHGGDGAILTIAQTGLAAIDGKPVKVFEKLKTIELDLQMKKDGKYKDEQVVELTKAHLLKEGVATSNLAVDITGAISFGSLIARDIGGDFLPVQFGAGATDLPASPTDRRPSNEVYADLVSELWYAGKPLVRCQQIKGLDPDTMNEMCMRSYKLVGKKIQVEPKKDMKKRTGGRSPDRSDSLFVTLFLARKRHGLVSVEKGKGKGKPTQLPAKSHSEAILQAATAWGTKTKPKMADAAAGPETQMAGTGGWATYFEGGGGGGFGVN